MGKSSKIFNDVREKEVREEAKKLLTEQHIRHKCEAYEKNL